MKVHGNLKALAKRGNMLEHLLQTHVPSVFPNFATRKALLTIVFSNKARMSLLRGRNIFPYANQGNIGEACDRSKCVWQHVSSFCEGLAQKIHVGSAHCNDSSKPRSNLHS